MKSHAGARTFREMLSDRGEIVPPEPGEKLLVRVQAYPNDRRVKIYSNFGPCVAMMASDIFSVSSPCCGGSLHLGHGWRCSLCKTPIPMDADFTNRSRPKYLERYMLWFMPAEWDVLLKTMVLQEFMDVVGEAMAASRHDGLDYVKDLSNLPIPGGKAVQP